MSRPMIHSLQVFRGLAALAVVLHHAIVSTGAFVGGVPVLAMTVLGMGYLGVDFFFVLSGFIIMYTHMDDESSLNAVGRYAWKRIVRIYPAYLPISIAVIALYALLPGLSASGGREFSLASSLFLVPADQPPALSVAWTLVHEMMFYSVFLLHFVSRKLLFGALLLWGGGNPGQPCADHPHRLAPLPPEYPEHRIHVRGLGGLDREAVTVSTPSWLAYCRWHGA